MILFPARGRVFDDGLCPAGGRDNSASVDMPGDDGEEWPCLLQDSKHERQTDQGVIPGSKGEECCRIMN